MSLTQERKPSMPGYFVILCAGSSSRMGRPKGLEPVDGCPVLLRHVLAARAAGLVPRVVLGVDAARYLRALPPGVEVVWNARAARTDMATSAALGLHGLPWALVTPVDVPPADASTLRALLDHPGPCVPVHHGREGHPVRVHATADGSHPAVRLDDRLRDARRIAVADPDAARDLDTPEAWAAWHAERKRPG